MASAAVPLKDLRLLTDHRLIAIGQRCDRLVNLRDLVTCSSSVTVARV